MVDVVKANEYNGLMHEKRQVNFSLPKEIFDAFEDVAKRVRVKEKWQVITAAIVMLIESPEHIKDDYIDRAAKANTLRGSFAELVENAKAAAQKPIPIGHVPEVTPKEKRYVRRDAKSASYTSKRLKRPSPKEGGGRIRELDSKS